jgi:hypothetical protein
MAKWIGRRMDIGIGRQTQRKVPVAASLWYPKVSMTFDDKVDRVPSTEGFGRIEEDLDSYVAREYSEGDIELELRSKNIGLFLYSMMGSCATVSGSPVAGNYTHTFSLSESNQHPLLTVYVRDPIGQELYPAGTEWQMFRSVGLNSLEISAVPGDLVRYTVNLRGAPSEEPWTEAEPSYSATESKFLGRHTCIRSASTIADLDTASDLDVKSIKLKIEKNLGGDDTLCTPIPVDELNKQFKVTGEIVLNYEDRTWRNYYLTYGQYRCLRIQFQNIDEVIGATATHPSLRIDLPRVSFEGWETDRANNEIAIQTLNFTGNFDLANNQNAIHLCRLINNQTAY